MKIAIIGGTGKEGRGLAVRWAAAGHEVILGSRDRTRGQSCAEELSASSGHSITGDDNAGAVNAGELALLSVPYSAHKATQTELRPVLSGKTVIDITVPLKPPKVREVHLPEGHSAALEAQELLGDDVRVVAALHHISSVHLADLDHTFDSDVLVCGDDQDARTTAITLIGDLGLRALDAGVLRNAVALEAMTPVLLHLNRRYKSKGCGLRITGLPPSS
ncbi:MAG: NADPH-dependent F420 reductase [Myxococcota bacterium]